MDVMPRDAVPLWWKSSFFWLVADATVYEHWMRAEHDDSDYIIIAETSFIIYW